MLKCTPGEQSWRGLQSLTAYVLIAVFVRHYLYVQYFNVVECQEWDLGQCHSGSPGSFPGKTSEIPSSVSGDL